MPECMRERASLSGPSSDALPNGVPGVNIDLTGSPSELVVVMRESADDEVGPSRPRSSLRRR